MRVWACLLCWLGLAACAATAPQRSAPALDAKAAPMVDLLIDNGTIWTGVAGARDASVVAIDKGRIVHVGSSPEPRIAARRHIDLGGRFAMAGFMDNHVHFFEGGAALASVDLRDAASQEEFSERIARFARSLPKGRWILNGNWDHQKWGGALPRRGWIDAATPDNPVFVIRLDGHMALANSLALGLAGITAQTPDPPGGEIERDQRGEPTGILRGNALNLVLAVIPPPSREEILAQFAAAQEHALARGIVKVHAVTANPSEDNMIELFEAARAAGVMKIRAHVSTPIEARAALAQRVRDKGRGDARLSWGTVKGFVDGSLGARTAWFYEGYADRKAYAGLPLNDPAALRRWMEEADAAGLGLSIHAIGDRAIDTVLGFMEEIAGKDIAARRYRIEHFQHPAARAIAALGRLKVIASMQPYHAIDDGRWAQSRIGPERIRTAYAFRSILDAGGLLTFGSDWPVAPLSPLEGVYAAVTRRTTDGRNPNGWVPEQKITVEEALRAYTSANAYGFGEEEVAGTIEPGKRADLVILSADPRRIDPEAIRKIAVVATLIDGEVVFGAPALDRAAGQ